MIVLSICIATRNRADVIGPTLGALLSQCTDEVEIVVVDGASTDHTGDVVGALAERHTALRYLPQTTNSGVDGDFDKAIVLARGRYCWLLSDDDLPVEGALARVLQVCANEPAAVIVDAEVYSADFTERFLEHRMPFRGERHYSTDQLDTVLADCGDTLSFIGALVIRRDIWLARNRAAYFGTEFIHIGVVFQAPLPGEVIALGESLLRIRYGVGNWARRSFEVWMFKWPRLIWSFENISESARAKVVTRNPWHHTMALLLYRAKGWYRWDGFRRFVLPAARPWHEKILPALVVATPGVLVFMMVWAGLQLRPNRYSGSRRDLALSPYAFWRGLR